MTSNSVCIVDFNGYSSPGHFPTAFWADWENGITTFGGDWSDVPDMPSVTEPSPEQCELWVEIHQKEIDRNESASHASR